MFDYPSPQDGSFFGIKLGGSLGLCLWVVYRFTGLFFLGCLGLRVYLGCLGFEVVEAWDPRTFFLRMILPRPSSLALFAGEITFFIHIDTVKQPTTTLKSGDLEYLKISRAPFV